MLVKERMSRNPITIRPDITVTEAQAQMRRDKIHHLPVVDRDGRLVGIVTEKDLLYASPSPATTLSVFEMTSLLAKLTVDKVMTAKLLTVTEDVPLEEAARIMADLYAALLQGAALGEAVTLGRKQLAAQPQPMAGVLEHLLEARGRGACGVQRAPEPHHVADRGIDVGPVHLGGQRTAGGRVHGAVSAGAKVMATPFMQ